MMISVKGSDTLLTFCWTEYRFDVRSNSGSGSFVRSVLILIAEISLIFSASHTARRVASFSALDKPISSSSDAGTQPSPVAMAFSVICGARASRFLAVSFLESVRASCQASLSSGSPFLANRSGKIAAPITRGPAQGPRPTSSIPRIGMYILYMRVCCFVQRTRFPTCVY